MARRRRSMAQVVDDEARRAHSRRATWRCPICSYAYNVGFDPCEGCGRDFTGKPAVGNSPPPPPRLRDG